ncbi:MAG TPA: T9SS type A sorting domain-containing protein [Bacteroidia bacterium]|nr:T9SS type A sorting domain-containing protein [Bacteroidia bacterium]
MYRKFYLITFIVWLIFSSKNAYSQFPAFGQVNDISTIGIPGARITLFDSSLTYFREIRTDATGAFSISNVPAGNYLLGAEKINKDYVQQSIVVPMSVPVTITLYDEIQPGQWDIIMQSPEPLGGTDLGILAPDGEIFYCHNTMDPFVFDPLTNDTMFVQGDTTILGCAAPTLLPDGKIIFAGGADVNVYGPGTQKIKTYDYLTGIWQPLPNMIDYRWYPTMERLTDGKLLITGGGTLLNPQRTNSTEIYDPATGTSQMVDTTAIPQEQSPILMLYDGKVMMTHRPPQLYDPVTQQWDTCADFLQGNRMPNGDHADHELVHLPEQTVVAIGYRSFTAGVPGNFIEKYNEQTNTWTYGANFNPVRSRPEVILLPGKNILVMAGYKEDALDTTSVNQWGMMDITDIYNPYTEQWRRLAPMNYHREYHALATLVPDGRIIMVGGEGQPGNEPPFSIIEAFKPPYLFRGVRPEIINFTQTVFQRGSQINFDVIKTDSVTQVILMSTTSVTHMMNCGNNRYAELQFTQTGNTITANIALDSLNVLDGYYLLYAMVDDIPSVAKIISIVGSATSTAIQNSQNNASDEIFIYPNPCSNFISIQNKSNAKNISVELFDITGKCVLKKLFFAENNFQIQVKNLDAGMYLIAVSDNKKILRQKIIVQH